MAAQKASYSRYFQLMLQPLSSFHYRLRYPRPPLARAMSGPVIEIPSLIHEAIDEETIANYNPNYYFSAHPGQVLNGRYKTITKLGWGFGSTVWLAEDMWQRISGGPCQSLGSLAPTADICKEKPDRPQYVAVKIGTSAYGSIAAAEHELNLSQHIARANPSHPGAGYIRSPIDNFRIDGPHGAHICLVYRPMRETLYDLRQRLKNRRLPPKILKLYIALLLQGLNYLHSECHLIHTGKSHISLLTCICVLA